MKDEVQQFASLPRKDSEEDWLKGYEILVYVSIKRSMNGKTKIAKVSLETISERSGCSVPTVSKYISKIEKKGYFKIYHTEKNCGVYKFSEEKHFEPFSYDFLDNTNLTKAEKLHILCTQQFMFKDDNTHDGKISYSDRELHEKTGLSITSINKVQKSLVKKGMATQAELDVYDEQTGLCKKQTFYHLDEFDQAIVFGLRVVAAKAQETAEKVDDIEERLEKSEREKESLIKDMKIMQKEIARLNKLLTSDEEQKEFKF